MVQDHSAGMLGEVIMLNTFRRIKVENPFPFDLKST
jgi:hypothetical protein